MKPIRIKTYFVHHFLEMLVIALTAIGFVFSAKTLPFFPTVQALIMESGETNLHLAWGTIPMSHAALYLAFLFAYLMFEFYGFKPAFYASVQSALAIGLCQGIFWLISTYALDTQNSRTDLVMSEFIVFDHMFVAGLAGAVIGGFTTTLLVAALIKKLTRNYFMFFRFPIAAVCGFSVFTAVFIYVTKSGALAPESMILEAVSPLSQFMALIVASVIPLYLLRLFLGMFRGLVSHGEAEPPKKHEKSLFKVATLNDNVPQPPAPPPDREPERENTVSQRIRFES
jgi:hypothetical protein